jgi:hypothetical protein
MPKNASYQDRCHITAGRNLLGDPRLLQWVIALGAEALMVVIFLPTASLTDVWQDRTASEPKLP